MLAKYTIFNNHKAVKVLINYIYPVRVKFFNSNKSINIIATSYGYIKDNVLFTDNKTEIFLDTIVSQIRCIITNILTQKNTTIELSILGEESINAPVIRTVRSEMKENSFSFFYKSDCKLDISIKRDIIIKILKIESPIFVAFGDIKQKSDSTDFVFPIVDNKTLSIPREIVWDRQKKYIGDSLCCYELIRTDSIVRNILYKYPISNKIKINEIPYKTEVNPVFKTPTGQNFDERDWLLSPNGLPFYA